MDSTQQELLNAQTARSELMKWKLILVSAIGSVALGFSKESPLPHAELALSLIPFTCVYVDILCRNLSIRTKMISAFLSRQGDPLSSFYQKYKEPRGASLESFALRYSTYFLSITVIPIGILIYFDKPFEIGTWVSWTSFLFYASGGLGIFLSLVVERRYQKQKRAIDLVDSFDRNVEAADASRADGSRS